MWCININVYKAVKRDARGRKSTVSGRSDVAYGELLTRYMFFGQSRKEAIRSYKLSGLPRKFFGKGYVHRAYWTQQGQEREL